MFILIYLNKNPAWTSSATVFDDQLGSLCARLMFRRRSGISAKGSSQQLYCGFRNRNASTSGTRNVSGAERRLGVRSKHLASWVKQNIIFKVILLYNLRFVFQIFLRGNYCNNNIINTC